MQNISFKTKSARMFSNGLLSVAVMLFFAFMANNSINAQSGLTKSNMPDAKSEVAVNASKLGVELFPFNTWDKSKVTSVVTQRLALLNMATDNPKELFKLVYYTNILEDLQFSVAPEVATVNRLITASVKVQNPAITSQFIKDTYNDLKNRF
ncbi:MAG: hypothetical protein J5I59_13530 [Saprospiraceae bacterium]|nr:hypothetical protein [Saprospiraceae bacterium]